MTDKVPKTAAGWRAILEPLNYEVMRQAAHRGQAKVGKAKVSGTFTCYWFLTPFADGWG